MIPSCSQKNEQTTESKPDVITYALINTSWLLQSFALGNNMTVTVPVGQQYAIAFSDSTTATGINDCNTFSMNYVAGSNGSISMQGYSSTKIYCGAASNDETFKVALQRSTSFEVINGSQLKIYSADKDTLLTFRKR
jgi:heat shock protein HslJ